MLFNHKCYHIDGVLKWSRHLIVLQRLSICYNLLIGEPFMSKQCTVYFSMKFGFQIYFNVVEEQTNWNDSYGSIQTFASQLTLLAFQWIKGISLMSAHNLDSKKRTPSKCNKINWHHNSSWWQQRNQKYRTYLGRW